MFRSLTGALRRRARVLLRRRTGRAAGSDWIELRARRIFILPTRAGWAFAALVLILLLGAVNYDNNLIFGLCFLLTALGLVAMLHTHRNLAHLQLRSGQGRPGFVGDRLGYRLWLRPGDDRPRYAVELRTSAGPPALTHVGRSGTDIWLYRAPKRRGRQRLGPVTVGSCVPLGLFYAWSYLELAHSELAYPAPAPSGPPPPDRAQGELLRGDLDPGNEDFRGLRNYRPGDSLRHVHWKAVARGQAPLTKEFGAAGAPDCWIDFSAAPEPDTEARLRRLSRWVLEAERAQRGYGLRLPGLELPPARGTGHRARCLAALATFSAPT